MSRNVNLGKFKAIQDTHNEPFPHSVLSIHVFPSNGILDPNIQVLPNNPVKGANRKQFIQAIVNRLSIRLFIFEMEVCRRTIDGEQSGSTKLCLAVQHIPPDTNSSLFTPPPLNSGH